MFKVIILRGPSGCGKSTYVRRTLDLHQAPFDLPELAWSQEHGYAKIVSSDSYFMIDGRYVFDPKKLGLSHGSCLLDFIAAMGQYNTVVVDNTNTTVVEIAPYVAVAEAHNYSVEIHCLPYHKIAKDLEARNTHGVPESTILKQIQRLEASDPHLKSSFPRATVVYP